MIIQLFQAGKALPKGSRNGVLWSAVAGDDSPPPHLYMIKYTQLLQLLTTSFIPLKHLKTLWLHFPQNFLLFNTDSLLKTSCILFHVNHAKFHTKPVDLLQSTLSSHMHAARQHETLLARIFKFSKINFFSPGFQTPSSLMEMLKIPLLIETAHDAT